MAEPTSDQKVTGKEPREVTFTCQRCHKSWNINQMKRITRFRPVLVVCPDCELELR